MTYLYFIPVAIELISYQHWQGSPYTLAHFHVRQYNMYGIVFGDAQVSVGCKSNGVASAGALKSPMRLTPAGTKKGINNPPAKTLVVCKNFRRLISLVFFIVYLLLFVV